MLRIAWFTPWSRTTPLRSAVISAASVNALSSSGSDGWDIELFLADEDLEELEGSEVFRGIRRYHYLRAADRHRTAPFDLFIYNIEDHPRCRFIADFHHSMPGLVLAHDVNLNRLAWAKFAHTTAPTEINQEMDELFGRTAPRLGDAFVRGWPLDAFDRIYRRGAAQLNRAQRLLLSDSYLIRSLSYGLESRTSILAYPLECFALSATDEGAIVVVGDSLARPQLDATFRALERASERLNGRKVLWLHSAAEAPDLRVRLTGVEGALPLEHYVADTVEQYQRVIAAAALVLVPGVDEYRGLSFAAATALASGKATIISALGSGEAIPTQAALKMERLYFDGNHGAVRGSSHIDDSVLLSKVIETALETPELVTTLSKNAQAWVAEQRSVLRFCAQLQQIVEEEIASLKLNRRVTERRYLAAQALHVHALMERLDAADLWREREDSGSVLFNSVLKAAIRDFDWLEAPIHSGAPT